MKCDELKSLWVYNRDINENCDEEFVNFAKENGYEELVEKKEVNEAIAELKQFAEDACLERDDNQTAIDELQDENRKLNRALWLARAERAKTMAKIYSKEAELILLREHYPSGCGFCHIMNNKWRKVERKCRDKAEQYK